MKQWLRLKLNDQLVDIASEGLLRPKLYDEKEMFYFTIVDDNSTKTVCQLMTIAPKQSVS
jgi:hypothetical protein